MRYVKSLKNIREIKLGESKISAIIHKRRDIKTDESPSKNFKHTFSVYYFIKAQKSVLTALV